MSTPENGSPVPGHVDPTEADLPGGGSMVDTRTSSFEAQAKATLVDAYRRTLAGLVLSMTPTNAARVLAQVSKVAGAAGRALVPLGAYTLEEEIAAAGPRGRRYSGTLDRETGGVHALRELASSFLDAQAPKQIADLYAAADAIDARAARLEAAESAVALVGGADAEMTASQPLLDQIGTLRGKADGLRKRADDLATRLAARSVPSGKELGSVLGQAMTGVEPDDYEDAGPLSALGLEQV